MNRFAFLIALSAVFAAPLTMMAEEKPEVAAQHAAEQWLAGVDEGKYAESWKGAAEFFQSKLTAEQWDQALNGVRKPLGKLVSRALLTAQHAKNLPGAPEGEYVVLTFKTAFEKHPEGVETVTPMLSKDGKWRVSGYFIR